MSSDKRITRCSSCNQNTRLREDVLDLPDDDTLTSETNLRCSVCKYVFTVEDWEGAEDENDTDDE